MIPLNGKVVVVTGSFHFADRFAIRKALQFYGAKVVGSVSEEIDILFAGHNAGSKLTKAEQLPIVDIYRANELFDVMTHFWKQPDRKAPGTFDEFVDNFIGTVSKSVGVDVIDITRPAGYPTPLRRAPGGDPYRVAEMFDTMSQFNDVGFPCGYAAYRQQCLQYGAVSPLSAKQYASLRQKPEDVVGVTVETTLETAEYLLGLINERPAVTIVPTESLVPLTAQLSDLIRKVFDNEEAFRTSLLPEDAICIESFYMASERCYVEYLNEDMEVYTTIKTADFLAWAEGLTNGC